jgi:hypothetical protein
VVASLLQDKASDFQHLKVFRFGNEVDVRSIPYTKGLSLMELARHLNIGPGHILAMGDGHNDISMFDPEVALHTGCPANSETEVIEAVHRAGGHVASKSSLEGVIEILDAYETDSVRSNLPEDWPRAAAFDRPSSNGMAAGTHHESRRGVLFRFVLCAVAAYVVLLVFASFRAIPFSEAIMGPCNWLVERVGDLVGRILWP